MTFYGNHIFLSSHISLIFFFEHSDLSHWVTFFLSYLRKPGGKKKKKTWDFPGGAVVKNLPANAGDTGSIPGPGRSHTLRSN